MGRKIRVGIVGYGHIGKIRAACLNHRTEWELIGICDTDTRKEEEQVAHFTSDLNNLFQYNPEALFICTTNQFLVPVSIQAINRGIHVFCEKPPGRSLQEVKNIREAEIKNPNIKLKFGFNHRYHAAVQDAKAMIESGRLGNIMWMRGVYGKAGGIRYEENWRNKKEISGGGILIDQGIHMLDLFRTFCGDFNEIKSCIARCYWPIDVEDNAFALLRNDQGQVAMFHSSATQWQHRFSLEIYLEKGYLTITGILSSSKTYGRETLKIARCKYHEGKYPSPNPEETITYYDQDKSWQEEVDDFANCILQDIPVGIGNSYDAYKAMELVERIYQADEQWGWENIQSPKLIGASQ